MCWWRALLGWNTSFTYLSSTWCAQYSGPNEAHLLVAAARKSFCKPKLIRPVCVGWAWAKASLGSVKSYAKSLTMPSKRATDRHWKLLLAETVSISAVLRTQNIKAKHLMWAALINLQLIANGITAQTVNTRAARVQPKNPSANFCLTFAMITPISEWQCQIHVLVLRKIHALHCNKVGRTVPICHVRKLNEAEQRQSGWWLERGEGRGKSSQSKNFACCVRKRAKVCRITSGGNRNLNGFTPC